MENKVNCTCCKIANNEIESNIVYESNDIIAFLDNDPINEGHLLIVPKKHYLDIEELPIELLNEIMDLSRKLVVALKKVYMPQGYSIVQNGGEFNDIGHFHIHIFPRYQNDGFGWIDSNIEYQCNKKIALKIKEAL